jgi:hypothetical protein
LKRFVFEDSNGATMKKISCIYLIPSKARRANQQIKFILLLLPFCLGLPLAAQDTVRSKEAMRHGFALYLVAPAFATAPSAAINDLLLANDYPRLPRGHLSWGIGGFRRWNRFVLGMDALLAFQTRSSERFQSALVRTSYTAKLYTAFQVYRNSWLAFSPYLALSGTEAAVFVSKQTGTSSLDDLLAAPGNTVELHHFSGGIVLGARIDFQKIWKENSALGSFRIGYRLDPEPGHPAFWNSRFTALTNAPVDHFNYFFFQLNIGTAWNWN